jgi:GNAT superfamily N-acetyltransferase
MIRLLRDIDHYVTKQLFQSNFYHTEDVYFKDAWAFRTRDHSFGLWLEGVMIGMAVVRENKLEYICIEPTQQGHGWGSILLQHVLSVCPILYLNPADDPVLCRWYEKHGFRLSKEVRGPHYTARCYVHHNYPTRSSKN